MKTCSGRLNLLADTTVTSTKPHTHPPTPAETHLLLDGTFKTAPNLFTQLVTIHGLFDDGWRMPLAYGLLPGKTQHHYEALLAEIASFGVEPQSVMSVKMMYHILINSTSPSESCSAIDATNFTKLISTENETFRFITSEGQALRNRKNFAASMTKA